MPLAPRTPKRRRIESNFLAQLSTSKQDSISLSTRRSEQKASVSEPVSRMSSPSLLPPFSISQPLERHPHKRPRDETPSWLGSDLKRLREDKDIEADEEFGHKGAIPSDDYDSWERGMLTGQQEDEDLAGRQMEDNEFTDPASEDILSPSLGQFPIQSRRRDRSQTAPEPSILPGSESVSIPQAGKSLRRHQSSPLDRKGSSAQLDALQRAYAIITDTGTSQVEVQDIMHARRLANQINQVLDEQMCMKFAARQDGSPDRI